MQFPKKSEKQFPGKKSKFYKRLILTQYNIIIKRGSNVLPPIEQIGGANGLFFWVITMNK